MTDVESLLLTPSDIKRFSITLIASDPYNKKRLGDLGGGVLRAAIKDLYTFVFDLSKG